MCSFISLSALLASIITYREGVPLWTAELNDLTVPESAEAREYFAREFHRQRRPALQRNFHGADDQKACGLKRPERPSAHLSREKSEGPQDLNSSKTCSHLLGLAFQTVTRFAVVLGSRQ